MTGSETKPVTTTIDPNAAPFSEGVNLSHVDIDAITARAAQLRAVEGGRLVREAWLTITSLWRGPKRLLQAAKAQPAAGTSSYNLP